MDFIDDFIQEYKNNPCLWKANSIDFKNRSKRQEAYLRLIEIAAKHGEHYNVERTKQKINNLRCAFRHQLKKYNELRNKSEKDEPYCPKRKYFESLMFLKDEEFFDKRSKNEVIDVPSENMKINLITDVETLPEFTECDLSKKQRIEEVSIKHGKEFKSSETSVETSNNTNESEDVNCTYKSNYENLGRKDHANSSTSNLESSNTRTKKRSTIRKRSSSVSSQISTETELVSSKSIRADSSLDLENIFSLACKSIKSNVDDHYSNLGKVIAHKLRSMDDTQSIFAEKIIADVLFQGQMKMLSSSSISQYSQLLKTSSFNDFQS